MQFPMATVKKNALYVLVHIVSGVEIKKLLRMFCHKFCLFLVPTLRFLFR
jgi:hypothetical protein